MPNLAFLLSNKPQTNGWWESWPRTINKSLDPSSESETQSERTKNSFFKQVSKATFIYKFPDFYKAPSKYTVPTRMTCHDSPEQSDSNTLSSMLSGPWRTKSARSPKTDQGMRPPRQTKEWDIAPTRRTHTHWGAYLSTALHHRICRKHHRPLKRLANEKQTMVS